MESTENAVEKKNMLVYTSLIYLTNALTAMYQQYYLYSIFFLNLTISSIFFHSNNTLFRNVVDKICILCIVVYGGYLLYSKVHKPMDVNNALWIAIILATVSYCIFAFFFGYATNKYCFDCDENTSQLYHGLLHMISSFGHHLIIFL
jgi:hypothetical protein